MMSLVRPVAVTTVPACAAAALVAWGAGLAVRGVDAAGRLQAPSATTAEQLLVGAAGLGLVAAGLWFCGVSVVCLHDVVVSGAQAAARRGGVWRPAAVRAPLLRVCAPTLGAALLCAAAPASASVGDCSGAPGRPSATAVLRGLPLPQRPVTQPPRTRAEASHHGRAVHRVVREGESLWSVAADLLGDGATTAEVDRGWRAIYRANRRRVGPDPDLLLPATGLLVPPSLSRVPHPTP